MNYRELADELDAAGCRTFWFGPAEPTEVDRVAALLGHQLPEAYAQFLCSLGGGGVEGDLVAGIDGTADHQGRGTVWGDTKRLREDFGLAEHLIVLRIEDDEFAWCLDCSADGGYPVVGLMLGVDDAPSGRVESFERFFREYVEDQVSAAGLTS